MRNTLQRFNTVNGKYCCNRIKYMKEHGLDSFNTVNGKYCCNEHSIKIFNTIGVEVSIP